MPPLNEVIRQCNRVSEFGIHADPGLLLNPATEASCRCMGVDEIAWVDQDEQRLEV